MIPILFESNATDFTTNGLGRLSDATDCIVIEEKNGKYELEMSYPLDGIHCKDIKEDRIIFATPSEGTDDQAFRIYKISTPLSGTISVYAEHISYMLNKVPLMPFTAENCADAMSGLKTYSSFNNPFSFWTDISRNGSFSVDTPKSVRSALGGEEGSILQTYNGGELEFNNFMVRLYASRGSNNGVSIRYGKNMTDLTEESDISNTYTGIVPYWKKKEKDQEVDTVLTLDEKVVWAADGNADAYAYRYALPVDLTKEFDEKPSQADLKAKAEEYLANNKGWEIAQNITVSFVALWQTEEYKDIAPLERVKLCDTVNVVYPKMDINVSMKVIKTEYNVLLDRYNVIEIGEAKTNLASNIRAASGVDAIANSISTELNDTSSRLSDDITRIETNFEVFKETLIITQGAYSDDDD